MADLSHNLIYSQTDSVFIDTWTGSEEVTVKHESLEAFKDLAF